MALARVRIVLVEPAGALNVGAIARVMKNMGLHHLVLVNPQCDPLGAEARQMAVHAGDVLATAQQVTTLPEALNGCQRAIATTARDRSLPTQLNTPRTGLPWLLEQTETSSCQSALIFGPEDRGLSNTELNYAQRFVRIPASPAYPALNLAQAVTICCYELYQSIQDRVEVIGDKPEAIEGSLPVTCNPSPNLSDAIPLEVLERYYQQLEAVLLKIGYLYPHTAASRMEKFRRLFNRAQLSSSEVAMLRGILTQVEWAIQADSKS
jgi:tRNA/rRNA methyltransferase